MLLTQLLTQLLTEVRVGESEWVTEVLEWGGEREQRGNNQVQQAAGSSVEGSRLQPSTSAGPRGLGLWAWLWAGSGVSALC